MDFNITDRLCFHRYGKIYLKAAKNCMEKGSGYAKNEIDRLHRMLEKVKLLIFMSSYFLVGTQRWGWGLGCLKFAYSIGGWF